ncbi:ureidoglycolate lyase [Paracoccus seriniphilus]|uniref:Ureidoglycolate lyase n=1 Tax=Paracoccus seriniphilus TaxID=184748 RepID=A0A239PRW9_9RHOB|nr:ureidoglycolate lyase [Paracoccus seriniphilus]WCR14260.1 ureidoglycolate lyase [Paracoccus seriniphilus]SNT73041.1 ureidoglycolate lyase [Paracoccus seriniphilus]
MTGIGITPLTAEAFAPFGDVISQRDSADLLINGGRCERHHALARVECAGGDAIISIFRSQPVSLPYSCDLLERHPLGSQAFMPLGPDPWMSIVAPDIDGRPGLPLAFRVPAKVGLNLRPGIWHGVLTPLDRAADFLVVDREGPGNNLEERRIAPVMITE